MHLAEGLNYSTLNGWQTVAIAGLALAALVLIAWFVTKDG